MADKPEIKNDAQTRDLREGDKPVVEQGIANAPDAAAREDAAAPVPEEKAEKAEKADAAKAKLAKAIGVKVSDVIGYSIEGQSLVTGQGAKFRLAADGKTVLHLSGPSLEEHNKA